MNHYTGATLFGIIFAAFFLFPHIPAFSIPFITHNALSHSFQPGSVLFVGDIMLAREVENIMEREGSMYPFLEIESLLDASSVTIGNFEASVPKTHTPTPAFHFNFNAKEEVFPLLKDIGFDAVSFANNHTYDSGKKGLTYMRAICTKYALICGGTPQNSTDQLFQVFDAGSTKVGVLYLNTVTSTFDIAAQEKSFTELISSSDYQVAYIHWGNEYEEFHSKEQEDLAHALVEKGIDAVVGHHPHVVQDIEIYNNAPIFYSLGNLVFDQYFSDEVQEGLVVRFDFDTDRFSYTLIPITSVNSPSQPQIMSVDQKELYLAELLKRSGFREDDILTSAFYDTGK